MDTYKSAIHLSDPFHGSSSSMVLKSHTGGKYPSSTTKTLSIVAPTGYGLFAALKVLDLRPNAKDYLSVSYVFRGVFLSNKIYILKQVLYTLLVKIRHFFKTL